MKKIKTKKKEVKKTNKYKSVAKEKKEKEIFDSLKGKSFTFDYDGSVLVLSK